MRMRLWIKLSLSFVLLIIVFGLIVTATARSAAEKEFSQYIEQSDVQYAQQIAGILSEELSALPLSAQMDTDDFLVLIQNQSSNMHTQAQGMMPEMMRRGPAGFEGMLTQHLPMFLTMVHRGGRAMLQDVAITDTSGKISSLFGTMTRDSREALIASGPLNPEDGIPIIAGPGIIGYVYAGTMLEQGMDTYRSTLLASINRSVLIATVAAFFISFALSMLLFSHIISPVSALRRAARSIEQGSYGTQVQVRRSDELGELSQAFNSMSLSLERSEQWKRRIISDAAHELRTPVSLLQGEIEMMLNGIYPADTVQLNHMYQEIQQLSRLVNELQALASAESGMTMLHREPTLVEPWVRRYAEPFIPMLSKEDKSLTFQRTVPQGGGKINPNKTVRIDGEKAGQVLTNVLSNAMRHTPSGGMIDVSWYEDAASQIIVSCEDSGSGIIPEEREHVFDRFYRIEGHRSRDSGGSGLGLAICKEIMALHGGSIRAVSPVTCPGARIEIIFPSASSSNT